MNKCNHIEMTLRDVYRASDITRWHMVHTRKQQSIAEHSFQVAMIAMRICEVTGIKCQKAIPYVIQKALFHDLPEVYTGDLPTPVKKFLGAEARENLTGFEERVCFANYMVAAVLTPSDHHTADELLDVVKMADAVEAIVFLNLYGEGIYAIQAMAGLMRYAYEKWPGVAESMVWELTQGPINTLESLTT